MYRVVYKFFSKKQNAQKELTVVKKKISSAEIVNDGFNMYAIVFGKYYDKNEATYMVHKAVSLGLWGGIQEI